MESKCQLTWLGTEMASPARERGETPAPAFRRVKSQEFDEADESSLTEIGAYGNLARKDTQLLAKPDEGSVGPGQRISSRVVFSNFIFLPAVLTGRGLIDPIG